MKNYLLPVMLALALPSAPPKPTIQVPSTVASPHYENVTDIPFSTKAPITSLVFDPITRRLFGASGDQIVVIDPGARTIVGDIRGVGTVWGLALAPKLGLGFASDTKSNHVTVFDLNNLTIVGRIKTAEAPYTVVYDPRTSQVFAMGRLSRIVTVIDAKKKIGTKNIKLDGDPVGATNDETGHIYINVAKPGWARWIEGFDNSRRHKRPGEIVRIDANSLEVSGQWKENSCDEISAIGIGAASHIVAGCQNGPIQIIDSTSGDVLASTVSAGTVYDLWCDPSSAEIVVLSGPKPQFKLEHEGADYHFVAIAALDPRIHGGTATFDSENHQFFLATIEDAAAARSARTVLVTHVLVFRRK